MYSYTVQNVIEYIVVQYQLILKILLKKCLIYWETFSKDFPNDWKEIKE